MTTRNLLYATLVVIVGLLVFNWMADAATAHHAMTATGLTISEPQPASITTVRWIFGGIGAGVLLIWVACNEYADRRERALQERRALRKT